METVQQILQTLLAEVQHLRVDHAVLKARLVGGATAADLLEAEKKARQEVFDVHADLVAKIESLA
jgi:hypothetical protein